MNNIIICSFFTDDDYYRSKQAELTSSLDKLGVASDIQLLSIPKGMVWSDICRKKITFLSEMCEKHQDKKVFWIDVDCSLDYLPDFITNFSADIIGFSRGFSSPMKVGYHIRSRFWEPCFLGINNTPMGRKFIKDANELEKKFSESATDDYFFEEAWRKNCDHLSYQIIPSKMRVGVSGDNGFFIFGASGNVEQFKGSVAQHKKMTNSGGQANDVLMLTLKKLGLYPLAKRIYLSLVRRYQEYICTDKTNVKKYKQSLIIAAINNKKEEVDQLKQLQVAFAQNDKVSLLKQASAIIEYRNHATSKPPLPLCWWFEPAPGNMGDWLSPYIVSRIAKRSVELIPPSKMRNYDSNNFICIGSIGKFINKHSISIGTGISRVNTPLNPNATYLSVRGPKTGEALESSGGKNPGIYGDPAIVMPRLYPKVKNSEGRGLLVRHMSHLNTEITLPKNMDEVSIFASSAQEIEEFIDKLHCYEYVITSAMHCYILCHAYGIPSALVVFKGSEFAVAGDGIKYIDYAEGVDVEPIAPTHIPSNLTNYDFSSIIKTIKISDKKIDEVYELLKLSLTDDTK